MDKALEGALLACLHCEGVELRVIAINGWWYENEGVEVLSDIAEVNLMFSLHSTSGMASEYFLCI